MVILIVVIVVLVVWITLIILLLPVCRKKMFNVIILILLVLLIVMGASTVDSKNVHITIIVSVLFIEYRTNVNFNHSNSSIGSGDIARMYWKCWYYFNNSNTHCV